MKLSALNGLKIIAVLAAAGVLFSGFLSYTELFGGGGAACGPVSTLILGLPACVYGFAMYIVVLAVALLSLKKAR